jgi:HD-like signal output (HDOD) protein
MAVCDNPKTSPADLNRVISLDPVLMAKVLRLVNSAHYGTTRQVTSLVRAIIMLGLNTVKNLALSTAVMGNLATIKNLKGLDLERFWQHSLGVGVVSKLLAKKRGVNQRQWEEYFTAGLLHDIGKIPLNAVFTDEYVRALDLADEGLLPLYQTEELSLEMNHCGSGNLIAEAWKLEGPVLDVITHHHSYTTYTGSYRDVLFCVVAANWFSNVSQPGFSGDCHPEKTDDMVWQTLGVEEDVFLEFEATIGVEIEKAKVFLNSER